ncbi:MAG: hypothetical protein ACK51L_01220 [bacterium]
MLLLKVAANGSAAADKINLSCWEWCCSCCHRCRCERWVHAVTDGWQSTFSVIAVAKNIWQIPCCSC